MSEVTTTTEKVAAYLRSSDVHSWRAEHVVQALDFLNESAMRRALRVEGTTLYKLAQAERWRRVEVTLAERPKIGAKRLAALCGYNETNSFYRAFESWTGTRWRDFVRSMKCQ